MKTENRLRTLLRISLLTLLFVLNFIPVWAQHQGVLTGKVLLEDKSAADFATVYLKGTSYGCMTDERGGFRLEAPAGTYTLVVSAVGFETAEHKIAVQAGSHTRKTIILKSSVTELDEVVVVSNGVSRVKRSAFNAVAVDTKALQNSTQSLSEALSQAPGLKLRESGGVGSDMQLMMDGFSGKHIKIFIDGVPQEGVGSSFGLNNIPVNFAERIEVYKGVVPVGFGTDALGELSTSSPKRISVNGSWTLLIPTVRSIPISRMLISDRLLRMD